MSDPKGCTPVILQWIGLLEEGVRCIAVIAGPYSARLGHTLPTLSHLPDKAKQAALARGELMIGIYYGRYCIGLEDT
ncbi:hypothetical protein FKM82_000053 [Ascaphus truei]